MRLPVNVLLRNLRISTVLGQLALLIRATYLVDAHSLNQVRGLPFRTDELVAAIEELCRD